MQQEENVNVDNEPVSREDLLKLATEADPDLDPELFGCTLEDTLRALNTDKVEEWNSLLHDYPRQKGRMYILYPDTKGHRGRGERCAPSYRNLYAAMDRHGVNGSVHLSTISVPLGIVPQDYYPIAPVTKCPGIERWFVVKNGYEWSWRHYRDIVSAVARQVAEFIHNQKAKRRHMVIVRKNSIEHDIVRTASNILGYKLEVYPCPYPLWSEEASDFVDDVVRMAAEDINYLDL